MAVATDFKVGAKVAFDYTTLDGEARKVDELVVDRTNITLDGFNIVTGYLDEDTARAYRVERIRNLRVIADD